MLGINLNSNDVSKTSSNSVNVSNQGKQKQKQVIYANDLTRYYQTKNLGLPQYQYYPYLNNQFICQIITLDGNMLCSEPKPSKEEACENLSTKYMKLLKKVNFV